MSDGLRYRNPGNAPLLDLLPEGPGHVLDCGCGGGDNARLLHTSGWKVTAITLDPAEREAARPYCEDVVVADLERGLPSAISGMFDVILMSHVLEHLAHPAELLDAVKPHVAPDGVIAVALPNVLHYRQRLSFLTGHFDYTDTGVLDRTHLRFYTFSTAQQLLTGSGFEIVRAVPDGSLPWMRLRMAVPAPRRKRIDAAALRRWPDLVAHQSLLLARPSAS